MWVVYDAYQCVKTDAALPNACVPVFVRATGIQAVIQMNSLETFKTDNPVKFVQHAIQVMDDIITAIPDVAGIQAYTQFVLQFYPVNDGPQFLERTANFGVSKSTVVD